MVARTLEAKLTLRLLGVVAPALVAVGMAAVGVTWWALDAVDEEETRAAAVNALAAVHAELSEPDPFPQAAREVLEASDETGRALSLRDLSTGALFHSGASIPRELGSLPAGSCAHPVRAAGRMWRACDARDERVDVVAALDVTAHARVLGTVIEGVALVILLALAAAATAVRTSLRGALGSVRALVEWSEKVEGGTAAPPVPLADTRELAWLAGAFDAVVRRLVDAIARARATSENIAHELRTPLTTIRAELEALEAGAGEDGETARAAARMRGDVERLARVVDAILVLAVPPARSRKGDCVVNLADLARELARGETTVDAPDEALALAEPHLVELAILLENARKHTGREARAIRVSRAGELVRIAVIDEGAGLGDEARARMFDRYWRGSRDGGGTGLGLALVRAVAQRHGGDADARPNADGRGLEVGITLGNVVGWHEAPLTGGAPD